jgi:hypothetical protein
MPVNPSETGLSKGEQWEMDFAALEMLPSEVRFRVRELNINVSAMSVFRAWKQSGASLAGVLATLAKLDRSEGKEMLDFAREHKAAHGYWLPHLSAEVSVQRYGPLNGQASRLVRGRWMRQRRLAA